ncbi:hypothetical protein D3C71_1472470 [compost metagenome]
MTWHEASDPLAQRLTRGIDDFGLGAARVGHYGARAQMRQHPRQHVLQATNRRGQQNKISPRRRVFRADGFVDQAQFDRPRQRRCAAPDAQHAADLARPTQRRGERPADEANAHHGQYRNQGASGPLIGRR